MGRFAQFIGRVKAAFSAVPVRASGAYGALMGFIREPFAGAWQKNVQCDDRQSLLAFAAVFACISRISGDIGKLRLRLVEQAGGIWSEVESQSPFWPVLRKPNRYQTRIQFVVHWITSKLLWGNTYALKERDSRGIVTRLHVLDPRRVVPLVTDEGDVYYQLSMDQLAGIDGAKVVAPASEIIHDRGVTLFHPLVGVSPIYACGAAATQGIRIQANSAKFFENMSRPSGLLTAPARINDETADRLKRHWEENFTGSNIGRVAVLGDGLKYEAMTIPAEDAQLIEQLKWTGEDVARAFGVPGYKIGVGPMPTNNNVEALEQQYYTGTLQLLIESVELLLDEGLSLTDVAGKTLGTEFDLDGLLRMDTATLLDALAKATGAGIMSPDEARGKLNLGKVPGGASPYLQMQNFSLAALAKRDAQDDPFGKAPAPIPAAAPAAPASPALPPAAAPEPGKAASAFVAELISQALTKRFELEAQDA